MNKEQIIKEYQRENASKGGQAIYKKYGKDYFSKMGKRSAKIKKAAKKLSTVEHLTTAKP